MLVCTTLSKTTSDASSIKQARLGKWRDDPIINPSSKQADKWILNKTHRYYSQDQRKRLVSGETYIHLARGCAWCFLMFAFLILGGVLPVLWLATAATKLIIVFGFY